MRSSTGWLLGASLVLAPLSGGCDFVSQARGLYKTAQEVAEHLEADMKAPLTDEKIDRVLAVTPELMEFSETAKEKWTIQRQGDVQQLTSMLGALSEYIAFFEARDTRVTEYMVDLMKIHDVRLQLRWEEARAEAQATLEAERVELEARRAEPDLEQDELEQLERRLRQNELTLSNLEKTRLQRDAQAGEQADTPYRLSDEERALVTARIDEIDQCFRAAGYAQEGEGEKPAEVEAALEEAGAPSDG